MIPERTDTVTGSSGVIETCIGLGVPGLPPEELQAVLDKLDEVCRQAQELQRQIRKQMVERARRDQPVRSTTSTTERRKRKRTK